MSNSNIWTIYLTRYINEKNLTKFYEDFFEVFQRKWDQLLSDYDFEDLCQLNNGNRLRPMLVYWGYLLNKSDEALFSIEKPDLDYIIDFSLVVESIHKMSLLIDDLIDGDIARHGKITFHVRYNMDNTILLAMNLLLKSYRYLHQVLDSQDYDIYRKSLFLVIEIAYEMTLGALKEVNLNNSEENEISKIKEIIELETSSIIKNGLILGYIAGKGKNTEVNKLLIDIGKSCGYIFQELNDLEPFGNKKSNMKHKGKLSTDILNYRKNIVISYIKAWANRNEINQLSQLKDPDIAYTQVSQLIKKYKIISLILEEVSELQEKINNRIDEINTITGNNRWCFHFKNFIDILISASKHRALD